MMKLLVCVVLLHIWAVCGQHGSFLSTSKDPLCVKQGNYCEVNGDCCSKACLTDTHKCTVSYGPGIALIGSSPPAGVPNRFGEENKKCQQFGDYCQIGRDCCSGECLVSTHQCIRSNTIQKVPLHATTFQGHRGDQPQASGTTCSKVNQQCSSSQGCCAFLSCEGSLCRDKAVLIQGTETITLKPNNILANRFDEAENQTVAPTNVKCLEIGKKCFREGECCQPLRCHGFLHQCVT